MLRKISLYTLLGTLLYLTSSCTKEDILQDVDVNNLDLSDGVKFSAHIRPLLSTHCGECHSASSSQTNYLDYNTARNSVTNILDRIQREEGESGFMPRNGDKLSQEQIDLIVQWREDGLLN